MLRAPLHNAFLRTVTAALLAATSGCATQWRPATAPAPEAAYVPTTAPAAEVWDAAVDFLVDTGTEWEFIDAEMRTARMRVLITRGPVMVDAQMRPRTEAERFADCGLRDDEPAAGWGDLWAAAAIRVRTAPDGTGLLKVVVPSAWLTRTAADRIECVSKGVLEEAFLEGIRDRVTPLVRGGG